MEAPGTDQRDILFVKGIRKTESQGGDEGFGRFKRKFEESGVDFDLDEEFQSANRSSPGLDGGIAVGKLLPKILGAVVRNRARYVLVQLPTDFHAANLHLLMALKKFDDTLVVGVGIDKLPWFEYPKLISENVADLVIMKRDDLKIANVREILENERVPYGVIARGRNGDLVYGNDYGNDRPKTAAPGGKVDLFLFPLWNWDFPPLGLAQVAAALIGDNHDVRVHDVNAEFWRKGEGDPECEQLYENIPIWEVPEAFSAEIYPKTESLIGRWIGYLRERGTAYIGISLFESSLLLSREFARAVRSALPGVKIVIGGPSADHACGQAWLKEKIADAVVFGEGELTVREVISSWIQGEERAIAGAWLLKRDGSVLEGVERPLGKLDQLPLPYYGDFNIYGYKELMLPVYFSRGCIARCVFCHETQFWKRFRLASTERILREIRNNVERYGINRFTISDSLMNGSHGLLEELADAIIEDGLNIRYSGLARLDKKLTCELLEKMKRSGCDAIAFGMESASQKVLNSMNKRTDVKLFEGIIRDTYDAGISCKLLMMVGFPVESWRDYLETVWFVFRNRRFVDAMNVTIFTPTRGTPVFEESSAFGIDFGSKGTRFHHWKSDQGRNTFFVRFVRYKILRFLWNFWKKKPAQDGKRRYEDLVRVFETY